MRRGGRVTHQRAQNQLIERGIDVAAFKMGWRSGRDGWDFPYLDTDGNEIARRYKAYDRNAAKRFGWMPCKANNGTWTKPDGVLFYHVGKGFLPAVEAAGDVLIVPNGESSFLTYIQAGIFNVANVADGEKSVNPLHVEQLKAWKIRRIVYYPDRDDSGHAAAIKWRDLLIDSGIEFDCRTLPDELPISGDANDLWLLVKQDLAAFRAALDNAPVYSLPPSIRRREPATPVSMIKPSSERAARYAAGIETRVLSDLTATAQGGRNAALYCASAKLIGMIKGGWELPNAERNLRAAGESIGLPAREVDSVIKSAWKRAEPSEVNLPEQPARRSATAQQDRVGQRDQNGTKTLPETPSPLRTPLLGLVTSLYQYGETGETAIYYLTCAAGVQPGELVTLEQLDDAQASCGFSIPRKTLEAYYHASRIILTPIFDDDRGVNFFLNPIHKVKSELCKRAHRAIRVESFRAKDTRQYDPIKGEEYIAPAIPADLPADALVETDLTPAEAAEAAELLKEQPFDRLTEYRRQKARTAATLRYKRFAASLSDTQHIALPSDMPIRKIGDLVRAHARAWYDAGLFSQWSVAEQCAALGVTKNTRKTILRDVGIEQDSVEITAEVSGDVQDAVRSTWQQQRAIPRSYKAIDDTGAVVERAAYRKADVEAAMSRGARVIVTYSRKVYHHAESTSAQQPPTPKPRVHKPAGAPIRVPSERISWARYPRTWVLDQLRLRYRLKFGQDAPQSATARQLVEAISGCKLEASARFEQNLRLIA